MSNSSNTAQNVEFQLIGDDVQYYCDILRPIVQSTQSGTLMPALLPHISRFVFESYSYLAKCIPDFSKHMKLSHESNIKSMRHKTKLFEERDIITKVEEMAKHQTAIYLNSHTGLNAWKKLIQPDLGLYLYDGHIISTTYTLTLYVVGDGDISQVSALGDLKTLGLRGRAVSEEIGRYLATLYGVFASSPILDLHSPTDNPFPDNLIDSKDVISSDFLANVFNGPALQEINAFLLLFTGYVNFVHRVLRLLAVGEPDAYFRVKYLTLYHIYSSLKKLQQIYYLSGLLTKRSLHYISLILKDKELKVFMSQTKFRNVLMHYSLEAAGIPESELSKNVTFTTLVEHFFPGTTLKDLNAKFDNQLQRISTHLEEWLQYEQS